LAVSLREAFEVGGRHVVEQEVVVEPEQLAEAGSQVFLDLGLLQEQMIHPLVETARVHGLGRDAKDVAERCVAGPALGDVELARRLAQASKDEDRGDLGPGDGLLAGFDLLIEKLIELQRAPDVPTEPDVTERASVFDADGVQSNSTRFEVSGVLEQLEL